MADIAIRAAATAAVPRDYSIPGAQELLPKSVSASLDGTGAGSSYFPCLQVLDPGGNVMFSAIAGTSVAAGVSADVSWFPRVNQLPASSTSVATLATVALIKDGGTIPNNAYTTLPYDSVLSSHDPNGVFSVNLATGVITTSVDGVFALETYVGFTTTGSGNIRILLNGTAGSFGKSEDGFPSNSDLSCGGSLNSQAGQQFSALVFQNSGGNATILHARSTITMLAPTP